MNTASPSSTRLQPAYLLHYTRFRETSFIVEAFTLEWGRIALVARGAAGERSRTRALYQPFRPLLLSWVGERNLRTLVGIEESGEGYVFSNRQLVCAYYVNELLLRLLGKEQAQPTLFAHYVQTLAELASATDVEPPLRRFELQLLAVLGLLPDLTHCRADGGRIEPHDAYRFDVTDALAYPVDRALPADTETRSEHPDQVTLRGASLLAMATYDFSDAAARSDAKRLLRRLIEEHLGGQPLNSRRLFDTLAGPGPVTD